MSKPISPKSWHLELESKPDFDLCMKRIYAWYEGEVIDRVPVRFSAHNAEYEHEVTIGKTRWKNLKERWMDTEFQVKSFEKMAKGKIWLGETFPVYCPNLGPNVYSSFYDSPVTFGEVTSWAEPILHDYKDVGLLKLNMENEYFKKIEEMTTYALERCEGQYMVGYTDLHPGIDCASAWRDNQALCMDFYDNYDDLKALVQMASKDFQTVFDHFDNMLKAKNQLSVAWMNIPSFGKMHIPSADFSAMISRDSFNEIILPVIQQEIKGMTHNIFHLDGKDVAKHIDSILALPEIDAIQWVQGMGTDTPIMQWVPLIKKIQASGKSVVVDLLPSELESFIGEMSPEGLLLCMNSHDEEEQRKLLKRVEKW